MQPAPGRTRNTRRRPRHPRPWRARLRTPWRHPVTSLGCQKGAVTEHAIAERGIVNRARDSDRLDHRLLGAVSVAHHPAGNGQLPEGEVVPATAALGLHVHRLRRVRQGVVRTPAAHGGAQDRPSGFERGSAVGRPVPERCAVGEVRHVHRRCDVARCELLPGRQDRKPRPLPEYVIAEPPQPGASRRPAAGPVIAEDALAGDGGRKVRVAGLERVFDGGVEGPVLDVPRWACRCSAATCSGSRAASSALRKSRNRAW